MSNEILKMLSKIDAAVNNIWIFRNAFHNFSNYIAYNYLVESAFCYIVYNLSLVTFYLPWLQGTSDITYLT